ncbi:MAG: TlpA family protein disulfide reductase [Thermomicrobiales bacterium]|nr:TlpA family protein disulfide reductase [Thermomicrobiales bacterium]
MSRQAGDRAPNLDRAFPDSEGNEYNLTEALRTGPLLLGIYKSSCGASKAMMPLLNRFVDRYGIFGLQVFGIAQDSPNVTRSFIRRSGGLDYPILIEGDDYPLSIEFDIFATPTIYVIRQDGTIAYTTMGFLRVQMEELSRAVADALGVSDQPIIDETVDEEIPLFVPG